MKLPSTKSKPTSDIHEYTFLIYGAPKSGKTTFCSNFDKALFIATEPGHKFQEIYKLDPQGWSDVREIAKQLLQQRDKKQFKTIVFDTADNAYKMAETYICKKEGITHMSDLSFGKGYGLVKNEFMGVVSALTQAGYGIIFISHAETRDLEEKSIKRSYTDTTLSGSARKVISGLCDFIFYCYIDNEGNRKFATKGNPNLNAGDRSGKLPEIMDLDYKQLLKQLTGDK